LREFCHYLIVPNDIRVRFAANFLDDLPGKSIQGHHSAVVKDGLRFPNLLRKKTASG
jgi:hypothetical protein